MNIQRLTIPLLLLAAPFAVTSAAAMTTSDNASKAPASKAAAPATPAKPASGADTKASKDRQIEESRRDSAEPAKAKK